MRIQEYGATQADTILLLHGGSLSWWNYRDVAEHLQDEYHVILPILDGHAESDRSFTTIEGNAAEIINFLDEYLCGSVLLIGGLSLGGQILLEMQNKNCILNKLGTWRHQQVEHLQQNWLQGGVKKSWT